MKSPNRKSRADSKTPTNKTNGHKRVHKDDESEGSDFRIEKTMRKAVEDPNLNKRRKSKHQVKMLEVELEANPHWTNEDMVKIAKKTGLSKSQVYKWNWDQKKKLNILPSKVYVVQLPSEYIDSKTGKLLIKSHDGLRKLQTINLERK
jgi:metal-sulfur cluster biosynthetic enzyme